MAHSGMQNMIGSDMIYSFVNFSPVVLKEEECFGFFLFLPILVVRQSQQFWKILVSEERVLMLSRSVIVMATK
jgi:hypothetical protein